MKLFRNIKLPWYLINNLSFIIIFFILDSSILLMLSMSFSIDYLLVLGISFIVGSIVWFLKLFIKQ